MKGMDGDKLRQDDVHVDDPKGKGILGSICTQKTIQLFIIIVYKSTI